MSVTPWSVYFRHKHGILRIYSIVVVAYVRTYLLYLVVYSKVFNVKNVCPSDTHLYSSNQSLALCLSLKESASKRDLENKVITIFEVKRPVADQINNAVLTAGSYNYNEKCNF